MSKLLSNNNDIEDLANRVKTRRDFEKFLVSLLDDFKKNGADWENNTLDSFLEGLAGFSKDMDGYYNNMKIDLDPNEPSWRLFADIFLAARVYE